MDSSLRPLAHPPLGGSIVTDLVIIGGGLTGLWSAIIAKQRQPDRDVTLLDAHEIAYGASGRNGGFISESLTHGFAHGLNLWPTEMDQLVRLGRENIREIAEFLEREKIEALFDLCGKTSVATASHHLAYLKTAFEINQHFGVDSVLLDRSEMQTDVHSPTYLGGLRIRSGGGLVDPARLCWGLRDVAIRYGVHIFENTAALRVAEEKHGVTVSTEHGVVSAVQAILATNAYDPLCRGIRRRVLPVYDHVLATETLCQKQLDAIGWLERQGITDSGNQFHYYRLTPDNRILWGGFDAIYYYGNKTDSSREQRESSFKLLASQFYDTFPQLRDLRFTHRWAGLIDSTSRFTPYFGTNSAGNIAFSVGYTGLGVGSSRFGARVALDLLSGNESELTALGMVRKKPMAFPPEPLRYGLVQITRRALAREDRNGKGRGIWLSLLDRFGVGFNS